MATEKMTKRVAFTAVVEGNITDEVKAYFEEEIVKLDRANEKRREKAVEKSAENALIAKVVAGFLGDEAKTASMVMAELEADGFERPDGKELNPHFVSAQIRKAVKLGLAGEVGEIKYQDAEGKTKKAKGYIAL